jgi:hypothetical protein
MRFALPMAACSVSSGMSPPSSPTRNPNGGRMPPSSRPRLAQRRHQQ